MSAYESLKPWQQQFVDYYVAHADTPNATSAVRAVRPEMKRPDVQASYTDGGNSFLTAAVY